MKEPQWLLRETVLALQERLLADFGGLSGLRDAGLLDSTLALAARELCEADYAAWLQEHSRRASSTRKGESEPSR